MMTLRIAATVAALLTLGGSMTQPTPNNSDLNLPAAVQSVAESPALVRIGVVDEIVESDNITVKISGSPVLVTASYLFPQYQPLLGDRVYVVKQDSQWFVLGTMSGPINSLIKNPSFEDGVVGALPTNWTLNIIANPAGTPTFTKSANADISGNYIGRFENISAGVAGTSIADLISSTTPATEGERWVHAFYMTHAYINLDAAQVPQGGNTTLETFIQFLDAGGILVSEISTGFLYIGTNVIQEIYNRTVTTTGANFVISPPGTVSARLRIRASFPMNVASVTVIGLDYMVLRRVA